VHSQGIRPDLLSAIFLQDTYRVATLRNYPFDDYKSKFGTVRGTLMAWLHLWALSGVDAPVACSKAVQHKMAEHELRLSVVQNGVDAGDYHPPASNDERERIRLTLGLPVEGTVFVSVGLLIPRKDPKRVIRGFQRSQASENGILVMLGDGPLLEECKACADEREGEVRFPGFVDGVNTYLQAADYFVSASHSEGLPNTVMEALASGVPVLLTDIPSHREILEQNPEAGLLFSVGSASELADCIDRIRSFDLSALRDASRSIVADQFNAARTSTEYQALYRAGISVS
jgi:glycosyltransferase involved in cell wall biosynthesis